MLRRQGLQLPDELALPPEREVGLDPVLDRRQPQVLDARDLWLGEGLVRELPERRPPPQVERLSDARSGSPAAMARLPSPTVRSKRWRSTASAWTCRR
jgi:hypothetical protein